MIKIFLLGAYCNDDLTDNYGYLYTVTSCCISNLISVCIYYISCIHVFAMYVPGVSKRSSPPLQQYRRLI